MLNLTVFIALFISSPVIAADGGAGLGKMEPWHSSPTTWTQQDWDRLLTYSPWALHVEATMNDPADVQDDTPAALPGAAEAGMPGRGIQDGKPRWDGGIARSRMGQLATIPVTVRWDSAPIIRQALERDHQEMPALKPDPNQLIITVVGLLPPNQASDSPNAAGKSSSDPASQARSGEENLEWFMANSRLMAKGEPTQQPQNVRIDKSGAVHLFFSRPEDALQHKRDLVFMTRFGSMNVQARFRPREMTVDGHPDW